MSTRLINIEKAKYSLSETRHYDELLVGSSLPTCDCRPTCVTISQDIYLLSPDSSRKLGVIITDVRLLAGNK